LSTTETTHVNPELPEERRAQRSWLQSPRNVVLIYTVMFIAIELVGAFVSIPLQTALDAFAAFSSINLAIFGYRTTRTAGLVMGALFTNRLVVLTLPITGVAPTTRIGLVGMMTVLIAYVATWVLGIDVTAGRVDEGYPLRPPLISRSFTAAITILSGFPIGWLAYRALTPSKLAVHNFLGGPFIPWVFVIGALIVGAFGEELLYRRLVAAMVQHTGQSQTPWISATLYGSSFIATHNFSLIVLMTLAGALFAWSCERTGSIKPVVTAHAVASILVFAILAQ
jgi:membrane protease YdiL (CAAX protease family)